MADLQAQLDELRRRIAGIDRKYANGAPLGAQPEPMAEPEPSRVEEWLPGGVISNAGGQHYQTVRFWERWRMHGGFDLTLFEELPHDLLEAISEGTVSPSDPRRWAFLDTETTGLAGGTGTYAFLIGVGWITAEGFRLRQYFLREPGEEKSALEALGEQLSEFDVLVTYNGKAYDQPLLETRFRLSRIPPPFTRMAHLDLLHGARRLWKLRLDSCRLVELESQILGVEREGDVPGELVPYLYFEYLRRKEIVRLVPVFHHNALDVLTLACLTAIVPHAFRAPSLSTLRHGAEMVGVARWMRKAERYEEALNWMRQALLRSMPDALCFRTMWDIAQLERKLGREAAAMAIYSELAATDNAHQVTALEELAKYYEHKERNPAMALEMTRQALERSDRPELRHRARRLERKSAVARPRRLL